MRSREAFDTFGVSHQAIMHVFLAASLAALGKTDEAAATVARFRRLNPGFWISS